MQDWVTLIPHVPTIDTRRLIWLGTNHTVQRTEFDGEEQWTVDGRIVDTPKNKDEYFKLLRNAGVI